MGGIMSGNPNCKKHESVAQCISIDSFDFNKCYGQGHFPYHGTAGEHIILTVEADKVTLTYPIVGAAHNTTQELYFDTIPNQYGGERVYFLCPLCSQRVRKLYLYHALFRCRKCAGLNYPSQQVTKGCYAAYLKMKKAAVKLDPRAATMNPHELTRLKPQKKKGMHYDTYFKLLMALYRSQDAYNRAWLASCGQILGRSL